MRKTRYLFVMPAFIFVLIFSLIPVIITIGISFTDYTGVGSANFIGLSNYVDAFHDPNFKLAIINTLVWVVAGLIIYPCCNTFYNVYINI